MSAKQELIRRLETHTAVVGVVGLGYVGLPLAVEKGRVGFQVVSVEQNPRRAALVNRGESYISDMDSAVLRDLVARGPLRAVEDFDQAAAMDVVVIFVVGYGFYYLGGVLDDYSRYLIVLRVVRDMTGPTLTNLVQEAVEFTGVEQVPVEHKPALLSDNGSGYISRPFNEYLDLQQIRHIFAAAVTRRRWANSSASIAPPSRSCGP
jgi:transposase InsO family protein